MPTDNDDHDRGLPFDLKVLQQSMLERRRVLRWALGASLLPFVGCGDAAEGGSAGPTDSGTGTGADAGGTCATIPEETAGPYPGDGSNGPNVLAQSGVVRSDIRSSFGASSGTAAGVPLTITLTVVGSGGACAPLAGHAVYLWHCTREGLYSVYSAGVTDQNYLRGVQTTGADGKVSFTSIFPGCYSGRWPHIHFEVYPSVAVATAAGARVATSQLALPQAACDEAYATVGYEASVANLARITLAADNVFSDGVSSQLAAVTGNVTDGYVAALTVPVAG